MTTEKITYYRPWHNDTGLMFWCGLILGAILGLIAGIWGVQ